MVRIPACHAGGRGFESRPLRHLFERRLNKHELQGCSSNWQSSGFQIRVLGVRISPPLPYIKPQSKDWGFFHIYCLINSRLPIQHFTIFPSSNLSMLSKLAFRCISGRMDTCTSVGYRAMYFGRGVLRRISPTDTNT